MLDNDNELTRFIADNHGYCAGIARRVLGTRASVDEHDVLQETLKKLMLLDSARIDGVTSIRGFVARAIRNTALTIARRDDRTSEAHRELHELQQSQGFSSSISNEERAQQLHAAIDQLSEQSRRCVKLWLEDLSGVEIAQILGVSPPRITEIKLKAFEGLREILRFMDFNPAD